MQKEVTRLRGRLQRASQEAKEKLQQENPAAGGSRTRPVLGDYWSRVLQLQKKLLVLVER